MIAAHRNAPLTRLVLAAYLLGQVVLAAAAGHVHENAWNNARAWDAASVPTVSLDQPVLNRGCGDHCPDPTHHHGSHSDRHNCIVCSARSTVALGVQAACRPLPAFRSTGLPCRDGVRPATARRTCLYVRAPPAHTA